MVLAVACSCPAFGAADASGNLADLSIEELSNIEITSVSRHAERLSDAAASIYVITADDIRRSGATSLPEALRLAPNLQVARINTGQYAISARGFNNAIGNKLLVLIDGRTVYTPFFSGVNWDSQFVMLADVERIEVISGPGASLWGANAVNGVINVLTRPAGSTQGALAAAGAGNRELGGTARYGGKLENGGAYRVYGMGFNRNNTRRGSTTPVADGWETAQAGFRMDWDNGPHGFTLQGDAYQGRSENGPLGPPKISGANLLARWSRELDGGDSVKVQAYYDHTRRDDPFVLRVEIDLFDVEFQHGFSLGERHRLVWGGGYRFATDESETHFSAANFLPQGLIPASQILKWGNLFIQDEIALTPALELTLGFKVETNIYTGAEYLPNARLAWKPGAGQLLWGAVSRAVRAPARIDRDFRLWLDLPGPAPLVPVIVGGPDFQSEVADVMELGYRAQPTSRFSYSVTAFLSKYDKLRSGMPPPAVVQNMMEGVVTGLEAWGSYQVTRDWRLSAGMLQLRKDLHLAPGSRDPDGPAAQGDDPNFQWTLRSSHTLSASHELDFVVRHVGALPRPVVPAYTAVDARWGWKVNADLEASLTLQNLFYPGHPEFAPGGVNGSVMNASQMGRAAFLKLQWRL